ncbi:exodeoxyribonuclease VII small subunit [Olivibacter sitiensis]|uniref:exodeoxyribonuclease VII small subunit n=1 Tax=Olivibacter sitiensis TaxID=376470 RepID=UPI0003F8103F|nr:exodeoxyribonuclease VII small subunit [Olivibacter sitiensis]
MAEKLNYVDAFDELQQIVTDMEGGQITVDELSEKVKRAALLIQVCKAKLTETEGDVKKILDGLADEGTEEAEEDPDEGFLEE